MCLLWGCSDDVAVLEVSPHENEDTDELHHQRYSSADPVLTSSDSSHGDSLTSVEPFPPPVEEPAVPETGRKVSADMGWTPLDVDDGEGGGIATAAAATLSALAQAIQSSTLRRSSFATEDTSGANGSARPRRQSSFSIIENFVRQSFTGTGDLSLRSGGAGATGGEKGLRSPYSLEEGVAPARRNSRAELDSPRVVAEDIVLDGTGRPKQVAGEGAPAGKEKLPTTGSSAGPMPDVIPARLTAATNKTPM